MSCADDCRGSCYNINEINHSGHIRPTKRTLVVNAGQFCCTLEDVLDTSRIVVGRRCVTNSPR
jgi:hypothetical protein